MLWPLPVSTFLASMCTLADAQAHYYGLAMTWNSLMRVLLPVIVNFLTDYEKDPFFNCKVAKQADNAVELRKFIQVHSGFPKNVGILISETLVIRHILYRKLEIFNL